MAYFLLTHLVLVRRYSCGLVYTNLGILTTNFHKTSALRLPSPDPVARERFGAGLEFVQSDCVPTQHALAGGLRFSQAHLSIRD